MKMENSIFVIHPYKYSDTWVFDDEKRGLLKEPFVSGIPEMIDELVCDINTAEDGFKLLFSASPFPGYKMKLEKINSEYGGTWYKCDGLNKTGWLCPALFKFLTRHLILFMRDFNISFTVKTLFRVFRKYLQLFQLRFITT